MKLLNSTKLISILLFFLVGLLHVIDVAAIDYDTSLSVEWSRVFSQLGGEQGDFARGIGNGRKYELADAGTAAMRASGTEIKAPYDALNLSMRNIIDGNLIDTIFNIGNLAEYRSAVSAMKLGTLSREVQPVISAIPLPAAAWLFGSAIIGFVLFSGRRKV